MCDDHNHVDRDHDGKGMECPHCDERRPGYCFCLFFIILTFLFVMAWMASR